jgi:hypothetical protein
MIPSEKAVLPANGLAQMQSATSLDPWVHGFNLKHQTRDAVIGSCGFKAPKQPTALSRLPIASDDHGNGYSREAAQALDSGAFSRSRVRIVPPYIARKPATLMSCRVSWHWSRRPPTSSQNWRSSALEGKT